MHVILIWYISYQCFLTLPDFRSICGRSYLYSIHIYLWACLGIGLRAARYTAVSSRDIVRIHSLQLRILHRSSRSFLAVLQYGYHTAKQEVFLLLFH
jgi:hypothetical protein